MARQLDTNAYAIVSHGREPSISMYGEWFGGNMPTLTRLWLTVCVRYNVETKSMT